MDKSGQRHHPRDSGYVLVEERRPEVVRAVVRCLALFALLAAAAAAQAPRAESVERLQQETREKQREAERLILLAIAQFRAGNSSDSFATVWKAVGLDPTAETSYITMFSQELEQVGHCPVALEFFRQAVRRDPSDLTLSARFMEEAFFELGLDGALKEGERVYATARRGDELPLQLGMYFYLRGPWKIARERFRTLIAGRPDAAPLHAKLAIAMDRFHPAGSISEIEQALALNPSNEEWRRKLQDWQATLQILTQQHLALRSRLRKEPGEGEEYVAVSVNILVTEGLEAAQKEVERWLALQPEPEEAAIVLFYSAIASGGRKKAVETMRARVKRNPQSEAAKEVLEMLLTSCTDRTVRQ